MCSFRHRRVFLFFFFLLFLLFFFFFNDTATTEIYTLSLHDALPISPDTAISCVSFESRSRTVMLFTKVSPCIDIGSAFVTVCMCGCLSKCSTVTGSALNSLRLWIRVTDLVYASSCAAVSNPAFPPPTIATSISENNGPSHEAQYVTPLFSNSFAPRTSSFQIGRASCRGRV